MALVSKSPKFLKKSSIRSKISSANIEKESQNDPELKKMLELNFNQIHQIIG